MGTVDITEEEQCRIIREICGNPFREFIWTEGGKYDKEKPWGIPLNSAWLSFSDGAVEKMARTIYDEEKWEELPYIADALEDAGCTEKRIMTHLRRGREGKKGTPQPHCKGCWALDVILQQE